jgi:hypothetical protein
MTFTYWPTPTGSGETLMKAKVGISHAGVCASEVCTIIIEAPIDSISKAVIAKVKYLFFVMITFSISCINLLHNDHFFANFFSWQAYDR